MSEVTKIIRCCGGVEEAATPAFERTSAEKASGGVAPDGPGGECGEAHRQAGRGSRGQALRNPEAKQQIGFGFVEVSTASIPNAGRVTGFRKPLERLIL